MMLNVFFVIHGFEVTTFIISVFVSLFCHNTILNIARIKILITVYDLSIINFRFKFSTIVNKIIG